MLSVVALVLFLGFVARYKWNNSAAKKEEILRLVAITSEEDEAIAKIQAVEEYDLVPPQPQTPPRLENRYFCAVCYSPTTTRCSRCKAARYCSGKCQIIHWRQGHQDECRRTMSIRSSKKSDCDTKMTSDDQFEMHFGNVAKIRSDHNRELDDSESSSSSPFCSSSTQKSETSVDASEVLESPTPVKQDVAPPVRVDSPVSNLSTGSHDADQPNVSSSNCEKKAVKKLARKTGEVLQSTVYKDERELDGSTVSEFFELDETELRIHKSSNTTTPKKTLRSKSVRDLGNHTKPDVDLRTSQFSKSVKLSKDECFKNETKPYIGKDSRPMQYRSSSSSQKVSIKVEGPRSLPSESENVQMMPQPTSKGLKTSMKKLVHQFRSSKQSKSGIFDMERDNENYCHKGIFPGKLFMHLYTSDSMQLLQPFGLSNCGNSCYANAVLQCLAFTRPIASYLLQGLHSNSCRKRDWCFICEFESLIRNGQQTSLPLSPVKIMSQIPMIGSHLSHGREEDAHEFLRNVVDKMQTICLEEAGVSGSLAEESSIVGLTFGGYLQSKIKCMKCSGRSEQCDQMMDLTVEIDGNTSRLEDALVKFTSSETLGGDDKYKCSRCKSYEKAKKKLTILNAPNILTIVLKRFQSGNLQKINKHVQFPAVLNLSNYISGMSDKCPLYHLYAVVVHLGFNAASSGHYVSYVKNFRGDWFRIDDCRVIRVDLETVLSVEAYIIFYARQTPRVRSLMKDNIEYSNGKTRRKMEDISSSNKKNTKTKSNQWMSPNDFMGPRSVGPDVWGPQLNHGNPLWDSSSDSSSIFSAASDAGSYSTDSTKDSSAEDISGYLFGSNNISNIWYGP